MIKVEDFLKRLAERGVIDQPDYSVARANTQNLISKADALWESALKTELYGRIEKDLLGNWVIKPSCISSAVKKETISGLTIQRPTADIVQQGGGMYGIALVGYTYIMEKAGIRFFSLGGTSAGAINTMLLGTIPDTVYATPSAINFGSNANKSELLAYIIANTDFSKFMDRRGIAGWLQAKLLRRFTLKTIFRLFILPAILFAIGLYVAFNFLLHENNHVSISWIRIYDYIIGTLAIVAPFLLLYLLLVRMLGHRFGINSGDAFLRWLKNILNDPLINISTHSNLQSRLKENKFIGQLPNETARMVLITSNLTFNRIVKFPESAPLYWQPSTNVSPAAYVRASMSIPFIFQTFIPSLKHVENNDNPTIQQSRFVDGGMLSNFPIREFHSRSIPRFPTFGVLLSESNIDLAPKSNTPQVLKMSPQRLLGYIISFLSTFRNFYDNDYLASSDEIKMRVVTVNTKKFNWLDFWMKPTDKEQLFVEGVKAAIEQLKKFDWARYLVERDKIQE